MAPRTELFLKLLYLTPKSSVLDLIERLLVYPPENRLTAAAALAHRWFIAHPAPLNPIGYVGPAVESLAWCASIAGTTMEEFMKTIHTDNGAE